MTKSANRQPLGGSNNGIDEDITTARREGNGDAIVQRQSGYSKISYFEGGGALQAGHLRIHSYQPELHLDGGVAAGGWKCREWRRRWFRRQAAQARFPRRGQWGIWSCSSLFELAWFSAGTFETSV
jgi:hypothetical protein